MNRPLFVFLILGLFLAPLAAARAESPFTVSDVGVAASGASATEAFNIAVDGGRRAAWHILLHRLTREQDWDRVPEVDSATLKRMISGYQVSNEKRSTTRYTADVTYTFNGDLVRSYLRSANIAFTASAARPLLVIPLSPSYAPGSDWTGAWGGSRMAANSVPLAIPSGDALDASLLRPVDFDTAAWSDVQPAASRVHASQVALALAGPPSGGHVTVKIRILSPAAPQTLPALNVAVPAGAPPQIAYADAAAAAAQAIGDAWKARSAIDFNQRSTLTAEVQINSLAQWGTIQQKLKAVPVVMNINVAAMTLGQAEIVIDYAGTPGQLNDFLSQSALALSNRDGVWWLSADSSDGSVVTP